MCMRADLVEEFGQQQQEAALQQEAAKKRTLFESRQTVLAQQLEPVVHSVLALLQKLADVESMVTVLHLLSFFVEGLGAKTLPHMGIIADLLPKVSTARATRLPCANIVICSRVVVCTGHWIGQ